MSEYAGIVQDELRDLRGNAMQGAVVRVYNVGTSTPATLYDNAVRIADATGGDALINDATTGLPAASGLLQPGLDANANYTFFADSDVAYDMRVDWQGLTFTYRVQPKVVEASAGGVTSVNGQTGAVDLSGTYAEAAAVIPSRGIVCFSWDDNYSEQWSIVRAQLATRQQKHTFFVNSGSLNLAGRLSSAQVQTLAAEGHEIGNHGKTHTNLTTLTPAQRVVEYVDSLAAIEALIGAGACTSFAPPFGIPGSNDDIHRELWLRYNRVLLTGGSGTLDLVDRSGLFVYPRVNWNSASHSRILEMIRAASKTAAVADILCHQVGVDITEAEFLEALNLADTLGVRCMTHRDAYPAPPGITDAGFEVGDLEAWPQVKVGAASTASIVTDTPDVGFSGTKSLRLAVGPTVSDFIYVVQPALYVKASVPLAFSGRYRTAIVGGAGSIQARLAEYDYKGTFLLRTATAALTAATWTRFALAATPGANTRQVQVELLVNNLEAQAWFDHLHVGPTALGSFG